MTTTDLFELAFLISAMIAWNWKEIWPKKK